MQNFCYVLHEIDWCYTLFNTEKNGWYLNGALRALFDGP